MSENALAKKNAQVETLKQLSSLIESKKDSLAAVASAHVDPTRLVKLAQAALSRSPDLVKCSRLSILNALMRCSELGVEPNSALPQRRMWLVPRWNGRTQELECIAQLDYRAEIQLARDTGLVRGIVAEEVRANDEFSYERSAEGESLTKFTHRPLVFGERGAVIGYYAAASLEGGEVHFFAMSKQEAEAFRDDHAQTNKEGKIVGPWASHFDQMAKKTCLHRLFNLLPAGKTEEAQRLQARIAEEEASIGRVELPVETAAAQATATEKLKAKLQAKKEEPKKETAEATAVADVEGWDIEPEGDAP